MGARSDLISQLQKKLRTVQAECSADDLAQGLDDAVQAYSELRPRLAPLTITWTAGQNTVNLPADFVRMEPVTWAILTQAQFTPINVYDGRGYGLRSSLWGSAPAPKVTRPIMPQPPLPTYTVYPGYPPTLVIDPAPTTAGSLEAKCYRLHAISDTNGQTTVPQPDWRLVVLEAVYQVYRSVVLERGIRPTQFEVRAIGNMQMVKMLDPDALQKLADACHAEFLVRLNRGVT